MREYMGGATQITMILKSPLNLVRCLYYDKNLKYIILCYAFEPLCKICIENSQFF